MPERGIEKMEERAEAARSRWRVVAAVATALLVAKSLAGKAMALIWRRPPNARPTRSRQLVGVASAPLRTSPARFHATARFSPIASGGIHLVRGRVQTCERSRPQVSETRDLIIVLASRAVCRKAYSSNFLLSDAPGMFF